ncbi:hypothetical protein ZIOFF_063442 [Zingiber officinale]|uniref:UDP-glucuronate decarboxylase n=1 Tax=Zingiber officinale TaxID=94328 RepID=A0A8J5K9R9_ZINOF|nr:hypothetical protein ZIOFF_063442 [Zingiber officinale]
MAASSANIAGLLGTHLMDYLITRVDSVIMVDNIFMGRKENVLHHLGNPNFEIIRLDLVHPLLLEVDQIYHLACPGLPVHYKFKSAKTIISFSHPQFLYHRFSYTSDKDGSFILSSFFVDLILFLVTSTGEVYGDPLQHPQVEIDWGNVNPTLIFLNHFGEFSLHLFAY